MTRRHARIENGLRKLLSIVLIYSSQTSEKIQNVLHLGLVKRFEIVDYLGRFRSIAAMGTDRLQQVRGATVMQEKQTLTNSPQWCRAKFVYTGSTLFDVIAQSDSQAMQGKIREWMKV